MNKWAFFNYIFTTFDGQYQTAVVAMVTSMVNYVRLPLISGVTLWIAAMAAMELFNPSGDPISFFIRRMIRATIVLALAAGANYIPLFSQFLVITLPNEIATALSNAGGGAMVGAPAFDKLLGGVWVSLTETWKNIPSWSPKGAMIALIAGLQFLLDALFLAVGFFIYLGAHILVGLAVTVGPLFIAMLLWEKTVIYFSSWIGAILALVFVKILIVAFLGLLILTEQTITTQIIATNSATGENANDFAAQIFLLVEGGVLFFMIYFLAPKVVQLAETLFNAAAPGLQQLSTALHGSVATGASVVARNAAALAQAAGRVAGSAVATSARAGMRSIRPAGRAP